MAKLKVETIPPVVPVKEFILRMSEEEAEAVIAVLGRVGGNPDTSRRKNIQKVYDLLYDELGTGDTSDLDGSLRFRG